MRQMTEETAFLSVTANDIANANAKTGFCYVKMLQIESKHVM